MSSIQSTRLRKGMLIKLGDDLFRILDLQHFTPGNKRGFVSARMRNIRSTALAAHKFRAEEDVERAVGHGVRQRIVACVTTVDPAHARLLRRRAPPALAAQGCGLMTSTPV